VDTAFLDSFTLPDGADAGLFSRGSSVLDELTSPEAVAAAIAYLASEEAASVTGTAFLMDGGATA
jgi:NAD(P)-dependent dehydrogenase (short-subunit alcohol dehydrogenase family)